MITAALNELKENFPAFLKRAVEEDEEVVITNEGQPVGVLRRFTDEDNEEYRLLGDPRFHALIAESRKAYCERRFTRLEDIDNE